MAMDTQCSSFRNVQCRKLTAQCGNLRPYNLHGSAKNGNSDVNASYQRQCLWSAERVLVSK